VVYLRAVVVGFGLGFLVALPLGPMSLFLIRSTLRRGWVVGLAIGAGIAVIDGSTQRSALPEPHRF
jgi:threonine/homoserine/homoserine lactone efflux protein